MLRGACEPTDAPAAWRALRDELDCWAACGRVATLWWRDDDAVAATPQLAAQLALAGPVPLALAVIPAAARPDLADALEDRPQIAVLQHGWQHRNHAGTGKKSEFPAGRDPAAVGAELAAGRERLLALFGDRALPILAPPWNRCDAGCLPWLAEAGLAAISRRDPRPAPAPAAGIGEVNVHADLVAWRGDGGFVGAAAALAALTGHLRARRCGGVDPKEPTGMLTHHLVQDRATGAFLSQLLAVTLAHPAAAWLDAREVFATA